MGSVVSAIVFQPPTQEDTVAFVNLVRCKNMMRFVDLLDGSKLSYMIFTPNLTKSPFVVLYSHGNAEHLGTSAGSLQYLSHVLGVTIIAYDYRGYGYSGPIAEPSEQSVFEDADAMYAHMTGSGPHGMQFAEEKVIIMGRSVGGGPATYLAEQHHEHVAGLILQSTFTSCLHVPKNGCLAYWCCCLDIFDNASRIGQVTGCPILLLHGDRDAVVPFHCSEQLYQIATKAREKQAGKARQFSDSAPRLNNEVRFHRFPRCNHNDIESLAPEEFYKALRTFIADLAQRQ